jgi:hypothetical protein
LERCQIGNFWAAHRAWQVHLQEASARKRIDNMRRHSAHAFALVSCSNDQRAEILGRSEDLIVV